MRLTGLPQSAEYSEWPTAAMRRRPTVGVVEPRIVPKMNVSATTHGDHKDNAASNSCPPTQPSTIGRNNGPNFFKQFEHTRLTTTTTPATAPGGVAGMWLH